MVYFNYFTCKEFFPNCSDDEILKCCKEGFLDSILSLFQVLDAFREEVGYPIIVTSTFRDSAHNKRVGGVVTSQHLYGSAVDFKCLSVPFSTFQYMFKEFIESSTLKVLLGQCMSKETIKTIINTICTILSAIAAAVCSTSCVSHLNF